MEQPKDEFESAPKKEVSSSTLRLMCLAIAGSVVMALAGFNGKVEAKKNHPDDPNGEYVCKKPDKKHPNRRPVYLLMDGSDEGEKFTYSTFNGDIPDPENPIADKIIKGNFDPGTKWKNGGLTYVIYLTPKTKTFSIAADGENTSIYVLKNIEKMFPNDKNRNTKEAQLKVLEAFRQTPGKFETLFENAAVDFTWSGNSMSEEKMVVVYTLPCGGPTQN